MHIKYNNKSYLADYNCDYATLAEYYDYYEHDFEADEDYAHFQTTLEDIIIDYPVLLTAENSDWRGRTGTKEVESINELIHTIFSFGNSDTFLRVNDQGLYIRTASHDVPIGFNIYIEEL